MFKDHRERISRHIALRDELSPQFRNEHVQIDKKMWTLKTRTWYRHPLPENMGRIQRQVWLFGLIGETSRRVKLFIVDARNHERLGVIVSRHIARGCTVHTDGWGAYQAIDWAGMGLVRHRNVHLNNLNRRNFEHCHLIEGLWSVFKGHTRRMY